jgi:hypothetical protein
MDGHVHGGHNLLLGLFDSLQVSGDDFRLFGFLAGENGLFTANYVEVRANYTSSQQ